MALISVIIPIYNVADYLEKCLESLLSQTYPDLEIICVNDGSTDKSALIVDKYRGLDKRIKLIEKKNSGAGDSRNQGLRLATGEYIWFVDGDDWVDKSACELLVSFCRRNPEVDVMIFDAIEFGGQTNELGSFLFRKNFSAGREIFSTQECDFNVLKITTPAPWNKLFRRDFILREGLSFQNLTSCNDVGFVSLAIMLSKKIGVLEEALYFYRANASGATSRSRGKKSLNIFKAGEFIKSNLKSRESFRSHFFYDFIIGCVAYEFKHGDPLVKCMLFFKSLVFFPARFLFFKITTKIKESLT